MNDQLISQFFSALEAWDATGECRFSNPEESRREFRSRKALVNASIKMFGDVAGVKAVESIDDSPGSLYFDAINSAGGRVRIRVSNHPAKANSHESPVWSFETTDCWTDVIAGLKEVEREIAAIPEEQEA